MYLKSLMESAYKFLSLFLKSSMDMLKEPYEYAKRALWISIELFRNNDKIFSN